MLTISIDGLVREQRDLLLAAESVMKNAYNPVSRYYVGAAVLTKYGNMFKGTFMENSSLGLTICAEPAAIMTANSVGQRIFRSIAVIGAGMDFESKEPVTPCGRCRQIISDFAQLAEYDIELICSNTRKDKIFLTTISELLPYAFGPKDLNLDISRFRT